MLLKSPKIVNERFYWDSENWLILLYVIDIVTFLLISDLGAAVVEW